MPKLIEAKLWDKILSVLGSGGEKKEKFLDTVAKTDPQLANSLKQWEGDFINLLQVTKRVQQKHNMDTSNTDTLLKKYRGY
jgi:gas vesicle protein